MAASRRQRVRRKAYVRSVVALALIVSWTLAGVSGFVLYIAPHGPRSGHVPIFFLTKNTWSDVHFWTSVVALGVTVLHLIIDWRALKACVRYLVSVDRSPKLCEQEGA